MRERWLAGDCAGADYFLDLHPELQDLPDAAVRLIFEEFCLRQERGEPVNVAEFLSRFPRWRNQLEALLNRPYVMPRTPTPAGMQTLGDWPRTGQFLGEYQILATLGQGSQGCVYLAAQPDLADRRVVLKVSSCLGREHLSLARLQHTNIVPLYA